MKYLYKYTYKGPDRACVELGHVDEVKDFLDARYVGGSEAAWRIFEYPLHSKSHQVCRLPVHLRRGQGVVFEEGREAAAVQRAEARRTQLEAWFALNRSAEPNDPVRSIRYPDMPSHYTWDSQECAWRRRRRGPKCGEAIGRMYNVKPSAGELYYLRLLLLHVPGATDWKYFLRRAPQDEIDQAEPATFRDAARRFGLLHDDAEVEHTLRDALEMEHTSRTKVHELFAEALVWLDVADPTRLWARYQNMLREQRDVRRDATYAGCSNADLACEAYRILDDLLQGYGLHPETFGISAPTPEVVDPRRAYREYNAELRGPLAREQERQKCDAMPLNEEQAPAFDVVSACVADAAAGRHGGPNVFYIDGPAGAGKTYLYTKLLHAVRAAEGGIALAVAMSAP